jgi:hypothetical protein
MKIIYKGLFLDDISTSIVKDYERVNNIVLNQLENLHVTFQIGKNIKLFPDEIMEKEFGIVVSGYSESQINKGFKVYLPDSLRHHYENSSIPHITTSMADGGRAKDTGSVVFKNIEPFVLKGRLGYYMNDGTIKLTNKGDF